MGSATAGNFINALNSNTLPTYGLAAPDLCDDTHNSGCGVSTGDQFLKALLPQILPSQAYRFGKTAVFVVWDEDSYIPNIAIAPSVVPDTITSTAVNHYGLLRATEEMLGLPLLGNARQSHVATHRFPHLTGCSPGGTKPERKPKSCWARLLDLS